MNYIVREGVRGKEGIGSQILSARRRDWTSTKGERATESCGNEGTLRRRVMRESSRGESNDNEENRG